MGDHVNVNVNDYDHVNVNDYDYVDSLRLAAQGATRGGSAAALED